MACPIANLVGAYFRNTDYRLTERVDPELWSILHRDRLDVRDDLVGSSGLPVQSSASQVSDPDEAITGSKPQLNETARRP